MWVGRRRHRGEMLEDIDWLSQEPLEMLVMETSDQGKFRLQKIARAYRPGERQPIAELGDPTLIDLNDRRLVLSGVEVVHVAGSVRAWVAQTWVAHIFAPYDGRMYTGKADTFQSGRPHSRTRMAETFLSAGVLRVASAQDQALGRHGLQAAHGEHGSADVLHDARLAWMSQTSMGLTGLTIYPAHGVRRQMAYKQEWLCSPLMAPPERHDMGGWMGVPQRR